MRLKQLLQNIREPPPDSAVGYMSHEGGKSMRSMPFVSLINIVWLFLWAILQRESFTEVILPTLLSVPLFLWLYLSLHFCSGPNSRRLSYVAGIFVLAYVLAPFNMASMGYLIFAFFSVTHIVPMSVGWKVVFGSTLLFVIEMVFLGASFTTIVSAVVPCLLLGITAIYMAYNTHQQRTLRRSHEEIMRLATLAERERIGRDLHDLLGHTLSVVALKSELARKLIDRDLDAARNEISEVERVARDALSQVRNAVSGIRNTALSAELVAATALLEAQGVKVKCETENVKLPHDRESALALSLREAATNIRRHSGASGVTIRVRKEPNEVVVEVADNGRGGRIVPGNGLNGMRERLGCVGGSLSLTSNEDGGTLLRAAVPFAA